ncbi:hypothetical protein V495_05641 [Pseudogymnoascus sp. VKM F-4514 (FW-929)]|nr:hypothetical protein V490_07844 [Pseudogymnoascus sp. VKM F-3557]KFY40043.1 hypothetical protein V495_05641 [Pseudogymnoascus sp. VKM F-4514 (FW-929)]KFY54066.1 hypothetical protein V497_08013 [Pseudogymnoascus sp. VKM F-4516 (FW-969)]
MPPKVLNYYITAKQITAADSKQKIDATSEGAADDAGSGMRPEDVLFLIDCLQNTTGGQVQIDCNAVAKKRNMTNPRSVANRIATMKKKYGLPLATSAAKAVAGTSDVAEGNNIVAVGTQASPVKRTAKKNAARKAPYKVAKREEPQAQSSSDDDRQSAIDSEEAEKMIFGEPDEGEDDGQDEDMAVMTSGNHDVV